MGDRNRGGQGQKKGGQETKKDCRARGRNKGKYTDLKHKRNLRMHLLSEANRTMRKLRKLLARGRDGRPGGITIGSEREMRLSAHRLGLEKRAKTLY